MMTYLTKVMAAATAGAFALAAPVAADTILFSGDIGVTVENGTKSFLLDINEDGIDDMEFGVNFDGDGFADGLFEGDELSFSGTNIYSDRNGVITKYEEGDTIGAPREIVAFGGPRMVNDAAMAEDFDGNFANWSSVGDTGYLGFKTEIFLEAFDGEEFYQEFTELYGYIEVTRGSLIFGSYAVSTGPITIPTTMMPAVPLPAGLPLMLVGLGALGLAGRKARKTA